MEFFLLLKQIVKIGKHSTPGSGLWISYTFGHILVYWIILNSDTFIPSYEMLPIDIEKTKNDNI